MLLRLCCREHTLYEFYQQYWIDFGRLLTDMEKKGMMVNREHLREAQVCGGHSYAYACVCACLCV
jgi:hypothetical protein